MDGHDSQGWIERQLIRLRRVLHQWAWAAAGGADRGEARTCGGEGAKADEGGWLRNPYPQPEPLSLVANSTTIQLDPGDGHIFSFELACDDRAGSFLRAVPPCWCYHFTSLGLAYIFDTTQARRWVFEHSEDIPVALIPGPRGERRIIACVPFEPFLRDIACVTVSEGQRS
jgi:hypothetical protein